MKCISVQVLASVVIPGFTIHQVVYFVHMLLENTAHLGNSELMPVAVAAAVASGAEISHHSVTQVPVSLIGELCNITCRHLHVVLL